VRGPSCPELLSTVPSEDDVACPAVALVELPANGSVLFHPIEHAVTPVRLCGSSGPTDSVSCVTGERRRTPAHDERGRRTHVLHVQRRMICENISGRARSSVTTGSVRRWLDRQPPRPV
jgi:hypothetical protein